MKKVIFILLSTFILVACDDLKDNIDQITDNLNLISNSDNIEGLKEALKVGTNNATSTLGKENGYYLDEAVKILLPEEVQSAFNAIKIIQANAGFSTPGKIVEFAGLILPSDFDAVLIEAINRAAEDAAPEAKDIFISAITNMSIGDATNILFTDSTNAATDYLKHNTYTQLQDAFSPIISKSLSSVKVGNYTALSAWEFFAEQNNSLSNTIELFKSNYSSLLNVLPSELKNAVYSIQPIETDLGAYTTGKALDGVFVKVADEEEKIRTDASARVNELLQRIFGQLDK